MSVDINMSLHQRHWFVENIIACSDQINVKDLMVAYDTENPFVVVNGVLWEKFYYDSSLRMWFYCSFSFTKRKNVGFVCVKLERSWFTAVVADIQKTVCC